MLAENFPSRDYDPTTVASASLTLLYRSRSSPAATGRTTMTSAAAI